MAVSKAPRHVIVKMEGLLATMAFVSALSRRNQGRSTIERPYVLSIHVVIVPSSLHVNISATEAGKMPIFGATSDMLEVNLRRCVTESVGLAASRSHVNQNGNGYEMR